MRTQIERDVRKSTQRLKSKILYGGNNGSRAMYQLGRRDFEENGHLYLEAKEERRIIQINTLSHCITCKKPKRPNKYRECWTCHTKRQQ